MSLSQKYNMLPPNKKKGKPLKTDIPTKFIQDTMTSLPWNRAVFKGANPSIGKNKEASNSALKILIINCIRCVWAYASNWGKDYPHMYEIRNTNRECHGSIIGINTGNIRAILTLSKHQKTSCLHLCTTKHKTANTIVIMNIWPIKHQDSVIVCITNAEIPVK